MSTAWKFNGPGLESENIILFLKGAVERVLDRCMYIGLGDDQIKLDGEARSEIISRMDTLAEEGLRVLALSARLEPISKEADIREMKRDDLENGFCFLGLVGIYDPPRPQSRGAVLECKLAGITPRMLTGDRESTCLDFLCSSNILTSLSRLPRPRHCCCHIQGRWNSRRDLAQGFGYDWTTVRCCECSDSSGSLS